MLARRLRDAGARLAVAPATKHLKRPAPAQGRTGKAPRRTAGAPRPANAKATKKPSAKIANKGRVAYATLIAPIAPLEFSDQRKKHGNTLSQRLALALKCDQRGVKLPAQTAPQTLGKRPSAPAQKMLARGARAMEAGATSSASSNVGSPANNAQDAYEQHSVSWTARANIPVCWTGGGARVTWLRPRPGWMGGAFALGCSLCATTLGKRRAKLAEKRYGKVHGVRKEHVRKGPRFDTRWARYEIRRLLCCRVAVAAIEGHENSACHRFALKSCFQPELELDASPLQHASEASADLEAEVRDIFKGRVPQPQDWVEGWAELTETLSLRKSQRLAQKKKSEQMQQQRLEVTEHTREAVEHSRGEFQAAHAATHRPRQ